jgi:hypothetical protein
LAEEKAGPGPHLILALLAALVVEHLIQAQLARELLVKAMLGELLFQMVHKLEVVGVVLEL